MKKKRFSIEQIVAVLKQAELGMPVADLIQQGGYLGTDVLPVEEAVRGDAVGSGARAQAAAGRERAAQEAGCRAEPIQGHAASVSFIAIPLLCWYRLSNVGIRS
jgi:hypothetical protein